MFHDGIISDDGIYSFRFLALWCASRTDSETAPQTDITIAAGGDIMMMERIFPVINSLRMMGIACPAK